MYSKHLFYERNFKKLVSASVFGISRFQIRNSCFYSLFIISHIPQWIFDNPYFYHEGGSMENRTKLLQWHPAFFAGIQVDLDAENSELSYVNEHQLRTKPKQIVVLSQLPLDENLWLRILSNKLDDPAIIERMLQEYEQHKDNPLYSSIVEIVAQANQLLFRKEGSTMSETLEAIINEKLDAREKRGHDQGVLDTCRELACNMFGIGISVEQIALITKSSVETVNEWLNNKGA